MKHLIIYVHPSPQSFCHALLEAAVEALHESDNEIIVRDLYGIGFDPVLRAIDLQEAAAGEISPEIRGEQFFVRNAEMLTFIYPVWWTNMPAMMKGYFDRVFSYQFAYTMGENGPSGLLNGKRAIVICTQSASAEEYDASGVTAAMEKVTDDGILRFSGIEVIEHRIFAGVPFADRLTREGYLGQVKDLMRTYEIAGSAV